MKPKALIIIVVVLAALFIVGMALGSRGKGSTPSLIDLRTQVAKFGGKLASGTPLRSADVTSTSSSGAANCSNLLVDGGQATINNGGFCRFTIREKDKAVRSMSLRQIQGSGGQFTTEDHNPEVKLSIGLNQCKEVQIMEGGGKLTVTCLSPSQACVFKMTACPTPAP